MRLLAIPLLCLALAACSVGNAQEVATCDVGVLYCIDSMTIPLLDTHLTVQDTTGLSRRDTIVAWPWTITVWIDGKSYKYPITIDNRLAKIEAWDSTWNVKDSIKPGVGIDPRGP